VPARPEIVLLALTLAACDRAREAPPAPASAAPISSVFSREAFARRTADPTAAAPPTASADPAVLDEILAAAPRPAPVSSASSLLGSDTGVSADAGAASASAPAPAPPGLDIGVGNPKLETDNSNNTLERALRAQLYWPLVQRCRAPDGSILPPEVVHLEITTDPDGYITPAGITARPRDPRFTDAARCIRREVTLSTFRAPPAARHTVHVIRTDVPPVD
jgi:hypothetical protein